MDYISSVIQFIEHNVHSISIKEVDELRLPFNVSLSKFVRDFKRIKGLTPRDYLIRLKIELANKHKSEDPVLTVKEVVQKIGWDLTERQFRDIFKAHYGMTFGGKAINEEPPVGFGSKTNLQTDIENDFLFSSDRRGLEEVIFRMLLLSGKCTIKDRGELCKTVVCNIENTCFRFPFLTFGKEFIFSVFFDPDDPDQLDILAVFTQTEAPGLCFIPSDKGTYLDLIRNVAIYQEESVEKDILESITNWKEMTMTAKDVVIDGYQQSVYYKHVHPKIDKNAGVFRHSQPHYDSIVNGLKKEYEALLNRMHLSGPELSKYIFALKEKSEHAIKSTIGVLLGGAWPVHLPPKKLDLLLQLAECPYMDTIRFEEYSFGMDENLVAKVIEKCPPSSLPELIFDYFRAYGEVEHDDENAGNNILSGILDRYSRSDS